MLNKLRNQSEYTRMIIAVTVAIMITSVVAFFWIWSMSGRFSDSKEVIKDDVKPFGILKDSIGDVFGDYKDQRAILKQEKDQIFNNMYSEGQTVSSNETSEELGDIYGFDIVEEGDEVEVVEITETDLDESEVVVDEESTSTE